MYKLPVYQQYNITCKYNNKRGGNDMGSFSAIEYRMWKVIKILIVNSQLNRNKLFTVVEMTLRWARN